MLYIEAKLLLDKRLLVCHNIFMTTEEIKKMVKLITGFDYISVRQGKGSMSSYINVFSNSNNGMDFKPFEEELRKVFNIGIFSHWTLSINRWEILK